MSNHQGLAGQRFYDGFLVNGPGLISVRYVTDHGMPPKIGPYTNQQQQNHAKKTLQFLPHKPKSLR